MANTKELQNRIKSIQDTMKITKAMYMMSSMKLRKAKQQLENTEPYFYGLQEQISEILLHFPNMRHLFFDNREKDMQEIIKKKGFLVITGDKGMAGAYNHNVLKQAKALVDEAEDYRLFVVGEVGRRYFQSLGYDLEPDFYYSTTNPSIHRARVITELIVDLYKKEELDQVYVIYTRMINSVKSEVEISQLLPLKTRDFVAKELLEKAREELTDPDEEMAGRLDEWFYIHPSPKRILQKLAYNYVTGYVYGVLVEGSAGEENARMMAMQSATDNAAEMIRVLSVEYNRMRQAAITQEITEVVGGAKALKKKKEKKNKRGVSHDGEER